MAQHMSIRDTTFINSTVTVQMASNARLTEDALQLFGFLPLGETIVGRDEDVRLLLDLIKNHRQVLITGISGLGKTTVAKLCVNKWIESNEFKYAVLVKAETDSSAQAVYRALSEQVLKNTVFTDNTVSEVYEHYNKCKSIFVLDNIEENCNIHKYLPNKKLTNIFILGTSQLIEFGHIFKYYKLKKLSTDSSVNMIHKLFLNNQIDISTHNIEKTNKLITDLTKKLDCHPLALEHAAAYILDTILYNEMSVVTSIEQYIKTFSEQLKENPPIAHPTTYRTSVYTALEMNLAKAINKSEHVRMLLFCMSYFDPTDIDITMFYKHPAFDKERIKAPLRELKKYSIISVNHEIIIMHRLIQTVCRDMIKNENKENDYLFILLNILFYYEDYRMNDPTRRHFVYFIHNLNIDKETVSTLYTRAFYSNDKVIKCLTVRLNLINCNLNDIKDWSALHCSVFSGHETFFQYFDTSEYGNYNDRMERYASDTWTVFHAQIIKNCETYLFDPYVRNETSLIYFFKFNVDQKDKKIIKGLTTLNLYAALAASKYNFEELIEIGCDVNIPDNNGMTPILCAAKNMAYDFVFALHRAGATYDHSFKELLSAASEGDHELVLALLCTTEMNCGTSDFGKTLLWWAVYKEHYKLSLKLIEKHADITGINAEGNTLLHILLALRKSNPEDKRVKHGIAAFESPSSSRLRSAPLTNYRQLNMDPSRQHQVEYTEVITELIRQGASINLKNNKGDTPLLLAAREEHKEVIIQLVHLCASIDVANKYNDTPLLESARRGFSEVVAQLLSYGANINASNNTGDTPLLESARRGFSEVVAQLLSYGANINARNNTGDTPLLESAKEGFKKVVAQLLSYGANINAINNTGDTALLAAASKGQSEVAVELLRHGANIEVTNNDGDTLLLAIARMGLSKVAAELPRHITNIDAIDNDGNTPLLLAIRLKHSEVVTELLCRDAKIEVSNKAGDTPLFAAVKNELSGIAIELMRRGAKIEARNNYGETPLFAANNELSETIELMCRGAKIE